MLSRGRLRRYKPYHIPASRLYILECDMLLNVLQSKVLRFLFLIVCLVRDVAFCHTPELVKVYCRDVVSLRDYSQYNAMVRRNRDLSSSIIYKGEAKSCLLDGENSLRVELDRLTRVSDIGIRSTWTSQSADRLRIKIIKDVASNESIKFDCFLTKPREEDYSYFQCKEPNGDYSQAGTLVNAIEMSSIEKSLSVSFGSVNDSIWMYVIRKSHEGSRNYAELCQEPGRYVGMPDEYANETFRNTENFNDKLKEVPCKDGYRLDRYHTNKPRGCRSMQWLGDVPICKLITCKTPPSIEHGRWRYDGNTVYHKFQYECQKPYVLNGEGIAECNEELNKWDGVPTCQKKTTTDDPEATKKVMTPFWAVMAAVVLLVIAALVTLLVVKRNERTLEPFASEKSQDNTCANEPVYASVVKAPRNRHSHLSSVEKKRLADDEEPSYCDAQSVMPPQFHRQVPQSSGEIFYCEVQFDAGSGSVKMSKEPGRQPAQEETVYASIVHS